MSDIPKKLLVLTSGGDAPGMNAGIRAVVRTAMHYGMGIYGARLGYRGLAEDMIFPVTHELISNCIQRGGTILQTGRYPDFREKSVRDHARANLKKHKIDALVVLGGDGSFRGAAILEDEGGPRCIGIPCTIDNDVVGSEYAIGFDTARNTALEAIDKIRDTASSHNRNFLVEVMGRASGFLAVNVGVAGGAEFILTPEFPVPVETLIEKIKDPRRTRKTSIIVVAEADSPGRSVGIAEQLLDEGIKYRVCILGHMQRGGSPTVVDRKTAALMGYRAVKALVEGQTKQMVAIQEGRIAFVSFPDPDLGARRFEDTDVLEMNNILCGVL